MSRTTKDRPYWVRVNDPKEARYEFHSCYHGVCDFNELEVPRWSEEESSSCGYELRSPQHHCRQCGNHSSQTYSNAKTRSRWRNDARKLLNISNSGYYDETMDDSINYGNYSSRRIFIYCP